MSVKEMLSFVKEELVKNKKYNSKNLYVCRLKFKNDFDESISAKQIYKVNVSLFDKNVLFLEEFYGHTKFAINVRDTEYVELLEMTPFSETFPEYFYPTSSVIECLNEELKAERNLMKKM